MVDTLGRLAAEGLEYLCGQGRDGQIVTMNPSGFQPLSETFACQGLVEPGGATGKVLYFFDLMGGETIHVLNSRSADKVRSTGIGDG